ncbi:MAG: amidohydrolase family protein [Phycisphaerales bacterium]
MLITILTSAFVALAPPPVSYIDHVNIVDVRGGVVVEDRAVLIRNGKVAAVLDAGRTAPEGAQVIDAHSMYLMPGLIDSHVHFTMAPDVYGRALLANGVILVRDMGGPTEPTLALRDELNAGERLGPRMIASGAIVDGDPPVWPFSEACDTPEDARAAVDKLADAGVDFIKLYSRLSREAYLAAVDEAGKRGLMAVGHVPESVSMEEAAAAGQRTAEHMMGMPSVVLPPYEPGENDRIGMRDRWEMIPEADEAGVDEKLRALAKTGIVQCPTLVVYEGISHADEEDRNDAPLMAYVPDSMLAFWDRPGYRSYAHVLHQRLPIMIDFVGRMYRAGVPMIVGTDLANPYVFPGFGVHREMELFAQGGIPPADVLRMATIAPAKLFGVDDRFGSVEAGKEASFVLLRANPLEDVHAVEQIEDVWLAGERYDRDALDEMLDAARRIAAGESVEPAPEFAKGVELEGETIREGRLGFTFGQWDAGYETFTLTKTDDGFNLYAEFRPMGGAQQPSLTVYELDGNMQIRRARMRELSGDKGETTYVVRDGVVVATRGDERQEFEIPDDGVVTGPNNVSETIVEHALALEPGESRTYQSVAFGIGGWRVRALEEHITRLEDQAIQWGGREVNARVYEASFLVDEATFSTRTYVDEDGVVLRGVMTMPFGDLKMELAPPG